MIFPLDFSLPSSHLHQYNSFRFHTTNLTTETTHFRNNPSPAKVWAKEQGFKWSGWSLPSGWSHYLLSYTFISLTSEVCSPHFSMHIAMRKVHNFKLVFTWVIFVSSYQFCWRLRALEADQDSVYGSDMFFGDRGERVRQFCFVPVENRLHFSYKSPITQWEVTNSCMMAVRSKQWRSLECRSRGRTKLADYLWLEASWTGIKEASQLDPEMSHSGLEDEKKGKDFLICICADAISVWKLEITVS